MKTCSKCQTEKPVDQFGKDRSKPDGLFAYCKPCSAAVAKAWNEANPERFAASQARYRARNRTQLAADQAAYRRRTYVPTGGFITLSAKPHTLYRAYAADGSLLYVGITVDPKTRLRQHRDKKPWWSEVARVDQESHPNREVAQTAETAAIQNENPAYNARKRARV